MRQCYCWSSVVDSWSTLNQYWQHDMSLLIWCYSTLLPPVALSFPWPWLVCWGWHSQSYKWNESGFKPPLCTYRINWARMVRWMRWHCPPDTGFEIRALAVWGRARYLSVTEAPHNTDFHMWMGKKHFCFFETAETGNRTPNSGVKGSGANHYPRAPALSVLQGITILSYITPVPSKITFNRYNSTLN